MATFTCPGCGAQYKLPEGAAGKKVRCHQCNHVSRVPEEKYLLPQDDGPIPIADEPDDFMAEAAAAAARGHAGAHQPIATPQSSEEADGYVRTGRIEDRRGPGRTFWGDVGWSFVVMTQPGNMITFVVLWVIYIMSVAVLWAPCVGLIAYLILTGWIWAFYFKCVAETASGEDDLPTMKMTEGIWEDIILPIIKIITAVVLTIGPSFVYVIVAAGVLGSGMLATMEVVADEDWDGLAEVIVLPFFMLLVAGVFFFPIVMLVLALGSVADALRIDLIVRTVFRTFLPYLAVFLLVAAAIALQRGVIYVKGGGLGQGTSPVAPIAIGVLGMGIAAYLWIVVMRIIGLYYRHYKHRFAWEWE